MTSPILLTIRNYVNLLKLSDIVDPKTKELLSISDLITKLQTLQTSYYSSEYFNQCNELRRRKASTAQEAKKAREDRRSAWVKNNLKLGDWVNVTGSKSYRTQRLVTHISPLGFDNIQGEAATGRTFPQAANTGFGKVTHLWNARNKVWEKVDDLIAKGRDRNTASSVLQSVEVKTGSWKFPVQSN